MKEPIRAADTSLNSQCRRPKRPQFERIADLDNRARPDRQETANLNPVFRCGHNGRAIWLFTLPDQVGHQHSNL